jgi:hypothetical protein
MIGQDKRGNWVAQDRGGHRGGLFVDRASALKFARDENGCHPPTVVLMNGTFELDVMSKPAFAAQARSSGDAGHRRRTA